jgi:hypothetical protein
VRPEAGRDILNDLDKQMPQALPSGVLVSLGGEYPVMVLDADDERAKGYTLVASTFHGTEDAYRVQQIPPDCAEPYSHQPLLGEPAKLN